MKKHLITGLFAALALTANAQSFKEWLDPEINAVNRAPMHTNYFAYESADAAMQGKKAQSTNYMTLNGTWKFSWVRNADQRPTDFWKVGFNDKGWNNLQVPAVWELNGYGDPIYVNTGYAWRNQFQNNPPEVPTENNHVGSYRREIIVPADWKGKDIIAHFGSVTSNMYLWVNGRYVGYSEDSKLEAEFDLTPYLKPGQTNLIAFQVFRWCDGTYLEDQDFFRYSGVGRDCYLYARNKKRIQDIRITPDLDEAYKNGSLRVTLDLKGSGNVNLELLDATGKAVATETAKGSGTILMNVENPHKWTAETQIIKTNSDLLLRLINDILDLSRLEANGVTLTWEECDVVQLCRQVVASVSVSRQSGNQFLFVSDYESFRMTTDIQRMQQVIINLMSNADKFTRKGQITLEFSVNEETEMAVFSVTDTGCGIPKEKQKLVFERFEKLNEYAQGTGLGLSICKLIVHKWKGSIWIDPDYTGGARFVFSHPLNIEKE